MTILFLAPLTTVVAATLYLLAKDFMTLAAPRPAYRMLDSPMQSSRQASAERAQQEALDVVSGQALARRMQRGVNERDGRVNILINEVA